MTSRGGARAFARLFGGVYLAYLLLPLIISILNANSPHEPVKKKLVDKLPQGMVSELREGTASENSPPPRKARPSLSRDEILFGPTTTR